MGKTIVVRLSEQQVKWLMSAVIQEEQNKSEILRRALNTYLIEKVVQNGEAGNKQNHLKQTRREGSQNQSAKMI